MGGISSEREVSLESGACVADALTEAGFDVRRVDLHPERLEVLNDPEIDVFFVALHGAFGEDGCLQDILEQRGLCYTGSGPGACRLAFDKMASKAVFQRAGVQVPPGLAVDETWGADVLREQVTSLGIRWVVKPIREGSSVGVHIVEQLERVVPLCHDLVPYYQQLMVEAFVAGREITVAVVNGRALPVIEIRVRQDFYDYQAKYLDNATEYLFDTLPPDLEQQVQELAVQSFQAFGLRDFARVDFLLTPDHEIVALEYNTIPGMTSHSLVPKAAAQAGLSLPDLCRDIVTTAYQRQRVDSAVHQEPSHP